MKGCKLRRIYDTLLHYTNTSGNYMQQLLKPCSLLIKCIFVFRNFLTTKTTLISLNNIQPFSLCNEDSMCLLCDGKSIFKYYLH
jgi:hypothetical protein